MTIIFVALVALVAIVALVFISATIIVGWEAMNRGGCRRTVALVRAVFSSRVKTGGWSPALLALDGARNQNGLRVDTLNLRRVGRWLDGGGLRSFRTGWFQ